MPAPHHSIFYGRLLFQTPNQQCQSTEGNAETDTQVAEIIAEKHAHTNTQTHNLP